MRPSLRFRRFTTAQCVVAVIGGVALVLSTGCGNGSASTELKPERPQTTFIGPRITASDSNFYQALDLDHAGAEIRVLEATALTSPNVAYLGAVAVWPRDLRQGSALGTGPKFPPPGIRGHHSLEQVIPAAETAFVPTGWDQPAPVSIAFGFRLDGKDDGAVNGMRIVYEVDGERKVELYRIAIIACPPPKGCRGADRIQDSEFTDNVLRRYGLLPE